MACFGGSEKIVEDGMQDVDGATRARAAHDERRVRGAGRIDQLGQGLDAARQDDERKAQREEPINTFAAFIGPKLLEKADLGFAQKLHARRNDAVGVTDEGQA